MLFKHGYQDDCYVTGSSRFGSMFTASFSLPAERDALQDLLNVWRRGLKKKPQKNRQETNTKKRVLISQGRVLLPFVTSQRVHWHANGSGLNGLTFNLCVKQAGGWRRMLHYGPILRNTLHSRPCKVHFSNSICGTSCHANKTEMLEKHFCASFPNWKRSTTTKI